MASNKSDPRAEAQKIEALIRAALPGVAPKTASGMLGWFPFHYRYESGREGDSFRVSLAARASGVSVYVNVVEDGEYLPEKLKDTLGDVDVGKSCIRIKSAARLDAAAFTALLRKAAKLRGAGEV